jgi:hypothetical protein
MRSAKVVGSVAVFLAAAGCSASHSAPVDEPAPRRSPASTVAAKVLRIPPGHLPPPGMCRVWIEGRPPGRQPKPRDCDRIDRSAPRGSLVLYRPTHHGSVVHVRRLDRLVPGVVVSIRVYDAHSGELLSRS